MSQTAELAPKLEGIYKEVTSLTVLELADLVKAMEDRLGIQAAAPMAMKMAAKEVPLNGEPKNDENKFVSVSMNSALDTALIYPTFFNFKRKYADPEFTNDTGIF